MRRVAVLFLMIGLLGVFQFSGYAYAPQYSGEKSNIELRWKTSVIPISFSNSLIKQNSNIKSDSDVLGAIKRSLETWEKVTNIKFETNWTDKQTVSASGNLGDSVSLVTIAPTSENLLMFGKDSEQVSARTRVFFNKKGLISEADIVLNPYLQFSTDGTFGTYDLESTLTHEIGHLLGLEHSSVFGATMHENTGKNGIFNLAAFDSRTLAETDISAIRAIYGKIDETECCSSIEGKLTLPNQKTAKNFQIWLEDKDNGKVIAETISNNDGFYQLKGISKGSYRLFSQELVSSKITVAAENLGTFEIQENQTLKINKKLTGTPKFFDLNYIGFNGQLSELAVPINGGKSYIVYLGSKKQNIKNATIGFNSPFLKVSQNSIIEHDFGEELSVISFEVRVESDIPFGEYSIFVESDKKVKEFITGSLVVEPFINQWIHFNLSDS